MTFLPVAQRELRVASRRPNTFWTRVAAALIVLVVGSFLFLLQRWGATVAGATPGREIFDVLAGFSLAGALAAGVFLTSDCLGEEKRDGTMGLLFLTNLAGYDVVLGKLLASSLRSFYSIIAIFPILAVTLLMGGVTAGTLGMTMLCLLNAMFLSLVAGLFVSAISRDSQKSMLATVALLGALICGGYVLDEVFKQLPLLRFSSPVFLFERGLVGDKSAFWKSLGVNQIIAWLLLGTACALLPRTWQSTRTQVASLEHSSSGSRSNLRSRKRRLPDKNPVLWLVRPKPWLAITLCGIAGIHLVLAVNQILTTDRRLASDFGNTAMVMLILLYLIVASQAPSFLFDMRRSGVLEMLMVTPLRVLDLVTGNRAALARIFRWPLLVCLASYLVGSAVQTHAELRQSAYGSTAASTAAGPAAAAVIKAQNEKAARMRALWAGITAAIVTTSALMEVLALSWFGMWMGLASKSANIATLKTVTYVLLIPWFAIMLTTASSMIYLSQWPRWTNSLAGNFFWQWLPALMSSFAALLAILKNAFLIRVAHNRLMLKLSSKHW